VSWPEQRTAGVEPIVTRACLGRGFAHPHPQSRTVGDWPLNIFDEDQAVDGPP
jgi:hypothetical protein